MLKYLTLLCLMMAAAFLRADNWPPNHSSYSCSCECCFTCTAVGWRTGDPFSQKICSAAGAGGPFGKASCGLSGWKSECKKVCAEQAEALCASQYPKYCGYADRKLSGGDCDYYFNGKRI